jgi:hypothetical protein
MEPARTRWALPITSSSTGRDRRMLGDDDGALTIIREASKWEKSRICTSKL